MGKRIEAKRCGRRPLQVSKQVLGRNGSINPKERSRILQDLRTEAKEIGDEMTGL